MFPSSPSLGNSFSSGWNIFMLWDNGGLLEDTRMIPWDLLPLWSLFLPGIFHNVLILQLVICTWFGSFIFGNRLQIALLCWENTMLVCVHACIWHKTVDMWQETKWNVKNAYTQPNGRLRGLRTSWCLELWHSKLFPASSKTIVTEIDVQQSANLIGLPGNLQAPAPKPG